MPASKHVDRNPPTVSIITGIYNSAGYLENYFRMLELQTYQDWEVILVDDGSQDASCQMIEDHAKKDPRIRLVKKSPEGFPSRSRAVGLSLAKGKLVAFCDHDDFWSPQKIEFQLEVFKRHPDASIVHTDRTVWTSLEHPSKYFSFEGQAWEIPITLQPPEQVIYQGLQIIFSSFMGPTELVRQVGFHPDLKGVDDFYLFVRLAQLGAIYQVALPLTYYLAHAGNLSHEKNIFVEGFYKVYEALKKDDVPQIVRNSILAQACRTEAVSLFATDRPKALRLLGKSLSLYFIPSTLNRLLFLLVTFFIPKLIQQKIFRLVKFVKFKIPHLRDLWRQP